VIAYYDNEYQRHAIQRLTEQNKLEQYPCLFELWMEESNWRPESRNKSSNASGIAQLMPATWKLLKVKPTADGFKQVDVGLRYIDRHYGKTRGICKAYAHHLAKGWY
jgi:membrane-bound lytic murein transglycosylase MltF